jgi:hypothetical protein
MSPQKYHHLDSTTARDKAKGINCKIHNKKSTDTAKTTALTTSQEKGTQRATTKEKGENNRIIPRQQKREWSVLQTPAEFTSSNSDDESQKRNSTQDDLRKQRSSTRIPASSMSSKTIHFTTHSQDAKKHYTATPKKDFPAITNNEAPIPTRMHGPSNDDEDEERLRPTKTKEDPRFHKKQSSNTSSSDVSDSLQYSSSDDTQVCHLRPTTTIRKSNDVGSRYARIQWQKLFKHSKNETTKSTIKHKRYSQFKLKTFETDNLPVGDDIHEQHDGEIFLFHNINGIKDDDNWHQILTTMKELQIDIFGFAELNKTMNHGKKYKWMNIMRKYFYYS